VVEDDRLCGILTDRDIVVRALAGGRDPATTKIRDMCSRDLTTVLPTDSVEQAMRLMRDKAIRRLPVIERDSEVVGIVSIGDLAAERDRHSVSGAISAAPPNQWAVSALRYNRLAAHDCSASGGFEGSASISKTVCNPENRKREGSHGTM